MYRRLIAAAFALWFTAPSAYAQCCSAGGCGAGPNGIVCGPMLSSAFTETKYLTPREKLKIERDSYQRQLDSNIKIRDEYTKKIDETSAQLKGYDDAI